MFAVVPTRYLLWSPVKKYMNIGNHFNYRHYLLTTAAVAGFVSIRVLGYRININSRRQIDGDS